MKIQKNILSRLKDTDIPTPRILHDGTGKSNPFLILEFVEGQDLDRVLDDVPLDQAESYAKNAGRCLSLAHNELTFEGAGDLVADKNVLEAETPERS